MTSCHGPCSTGSATACDRAFGSWIRTRGATQRSQPSPHRPGGLRRRRTRRRVCGPHQGSAYSLVKKRASHSTSGRKRAAGGLATARPQRQSLCAVGSFARARLTIAGQARRLREPLPPRSCVGKTESHRILDGGSLRSDKNKRCQAGRLALASHTLTTAVNYDCHAILRRRRYDMWHASRAFGDCPCEKTDVPCNVPTTTSVASRASVGSSQGSG